MKYYKVISFVLIFWVFSSSGCRTNQVSGSTAFENLNLKYLSENSEKFLGKIVELEGNYLGWSGSGCNYIQNHAHQITRSDWTFSDNDSACIFVTGGKPDFLNPLENDDNGKKIMLIAKLRKNEENKIYLEFVSANSK